MTVRRGRQGPDVAPGDPGAPAPLSGLGFDPVVAAAWLYYQDDLTQSEIAGLLGVSRATVVNLLGEARRRGVVHVALDPGAAGRVALARGLAARYGLADCVLVPDDGGASHPAERIGTAGAQLLARELRSGDRLGVSFGRTVLALSKALPAPAPPLRDIEVVQITGSLTAKDAFSPELCTLNVATRLQAHCNHLHAPMFVSSPTMRAMLTAEPPIAGHLALARSCNRVVFGVADLTIDGTIFQSGMFTPAEIAPYVARGAIAIIASHFVDIDGRPVDGAHHERLVGITLAELAAIPQRICVSGGPDKVNALHACLAGGYVTHLVTDERTARELLQQG